MPGPAQAAPSAKSLESVGYPQRQAAARIQPSWLIEILLSPQPEYDWTVTPCTVLDGTSDTGNRDLNTVFQLKPELKVMKKKHLEGWDVLYIIYFMLYTTLIL